jgi:hypothetical protein
MQSGYGKPPLTLEQRIKKYCEKRIVSVMNDRTQLNIISRAAVLDALRGDGEMLSPTEEKHLTDHSEMREFIDAVRAKGVELIAAENYAYEDAEWPTPSQNLIDLGHAN